MPASKKNTKHMCAMFFLIIRFLLPLSFSSLALIHVHNALACQNNLFVSMLVRGNTSILFILSRGKILL